VFITKGDANNAPDFQEVTLADVQGKVLLAVPLAGYGVNFVKTPLGLFLVIIIPVIVIVASEVRKIYVELKKKKEKTV
jgi:signal peptidase